MGRIGIKSDFDLTQMKMAEYRFKKIIHHLMESENGSCFSVSKPNGDG